MASKSRFQLHYYTSSHIQVNSVILKINNRVKEEGSDNPSHALEKVVRTKYINLKKYKLFHLDDFITIDNLFYEDGVMLVLTGALWNRLCEL